jgi:hypothetical protein
VPCVVWQPVPDTLSLLPTAPALLVRIQALNPGTCLFETAGDRRFRFRLEQVLGQGGCGITYLATDFELNEPCVVKELALATMCTRHAAVGTIQVRSGQESAYHSWLMRFEREAHAIHKISHANVIRVRASWRERGTAYYAMDLVLGAQELPSPDEADWSPMPWGRAERIALGMLSALKAVHDAGLIHGDIKPSNVLLDRADRPILIDFGTVRTQTDLHRTATGAMYTPGFAPPELSSRDDLSNAGSWSDLYAWAMVVWGLVAMQPGTDGRPMDAATRLEVVASRGRDPYAAPAKVLANAGVPVVWRDVLVACLELAPQRRPKQVPEIWFAVRQTASGTGSGESPEVPGNVRTAPVIGLAPAMDRGPAQVAGTLRQAPSRRRASGAQPWQLALVAGALICTAALVGLALPAGDPEPGRPVAPGSPRSSGAQPAPTSVSPSTQREGGNRSSLVSASPELLYGTWSVDMARSLRASNLNEEHFLALASAAGEVASMTVTFERSGSMLLRAHALGETETERHQYRVVDRQGDALAVEVIQGNSKGRTSETAVVRFMDRNTLECPLGNEVSIYLTRTE